MTVAEQKFDVFSLDELELIQKILSKVHQQDHASLPDIYTNGFTPKDPVYLAIKALVIDRINQRFSNPITSLSVGMQLITQNPFVPHSDYSDKGDTGGGHAYLIPLWVKHSNSDTEKKSSYTIIFDQVFKQPGGITNYIDSDPPLPEQTAEHIWDEHMTRWPREWARYLSVHTMAEWRLGSVIYWNRDFMHASDDFLSKNILEKSALVLFAQ